MENINTDDIILPDIVSFETAELLKEKGFNITCTRYYTPEGVMMDHSPLIARNSDYKHEEISAPELWLAQRWLIKKHNYFVTATQDGGFWFYRIEDYNNRSSDGTIHLRVKNTYSKTIEEAIDSGIYFVLETLI